VLVIKSAGGEHTAGAAALRQAARNFPGVIVMDQVIPGDAITRLYDLCDCYVSLHRAEGFGLTIAEAMAAGKPVIATAYGGNLDFMTFDNSYPVDARIVELQTDHGPYKKGWTWADPDLDKASELMRRVYENRDEAAAKGERAADDIRRRLSAKAVGQLVKSRLEEIAADKGINL
jgi:glycosyltransferase involved in cell wall biosynthesis